jgi:CRP-like cAMP-binding protein
VESTRLTPGFYVGEMGLLTGEPLSGDISALTQTVAYEIGKDALIPILKARPAFADELGEALELRQQARQTALNHLPPVLLPPPTIAARLTETIRRLFSLH